MKNGVGPYYVTNGINAHNYVAAPETTWQDQVVVHGAYWRQPQYIRQPPVGVHVPSGSKAGLHGCGACSGWGQAPDNVSALMAAAVPGGADATPPASASSLIVPLLLAGGALLIFVGTLRKRG